MAIIQEPIWDYQFIPKGLADEFYEKFNNVRWLLDDKISNDTLEFISSYTEPFQYVDRTVYHPGFGTIETKVPLHYWFYIYADVDNKRGKRIRVRKVLRMYQDT